MEKIRGFYAKRPWLTGVSCLTGLDLFCAVGSRSDGRDRVRRPGGGGTPEHGGAAMPAAGHRRRSANPALQGTKNSTVCPGSKSVERGS